MNVTTKTLARIRAMNADGHNDSTISDELGLHVTTVRKWRMQMGLPPIRKYRRAKLKKYTVYDTYADEIVAEGTANECADSLVISKSYFFSSITKNRKGTPARYIIREVG